MSSARAVALRLFLTCWLVYGLHFATNIVREVYLGLAIGDHLSFRVDEYAGLHPDLFDKPGYGWHIGNNPGASMVAAIPYAVARPMVDLVVERVNSSRKASGAQPPRYDSPWPMARAFFEESWRRGYDVKFALGAWVMHTFCMAPLSALSVALMYLLLRRWFGPGSVSLWLALLYAFGTPLFFRTGYLNQNMIAGHCALAGFAALWMMDTRRGALLAGLAGGTALLMDYSGAVVLAALLGYCLWTRRRDLAACLAGAVPPVLLLWFYQWQSFGNPFLPGQHWMPPVEWIERGYQGVSGPQPELAWMLAFDYRFGLFAVCPLFLLALAAPWLKRSPVPGRAVAAMLGTAALLLAFFSCVNYTRLQFNTGLRYMAPALPLLYIPAAAVLARLPRAAQYFIGVAAVAQAWSMAMYRDVERGWGVLDPIARVLAGGFQLPALTTLARLGGRTELLELGVSPLPLFALAAALIYGIWRKWE
ncbi:MAG: hypothetical protein HZB13_14955 [Acidobacteria bacterium]|nr:hypothetical protein [Acidobacteriota bacterium]